MDKVSLIGLQVSLVCIIIALYAEYRYIRTVDKALQDLMNVLLEACKRKEGGSDK